MYGTSELRDVHRYDNTVYRKTFISAFTEDILVYKPKSSQCGS